MQKYSVKAKNTGKLCSETHHSKMKSKNGNPVLTLQNHQNLSDLTLDLVAHQEEPDCDLCCARKGIEVYEAHPDSQSCILQAS